MAFKMKSSLDKLLNKPDMSKLRSKQARSRKGISEHQPFSAPNSQGDEPIVTYDEKESPLEIYSKPKGKRTKY